LMLEQSPSLADRISGLYDHILVDEYQDTNLLQARVLRGMCRRHRNITVVALEQNYRSTQPILDATNTLISRAVERFTKSLWTQRAGSEPGWLVTTRDEQQQTRFVVDR